MPFFVDAKNVDFCPCTAVPTEPECQYRIPGKRGLNPKRQNLSAWERASPRIGRTDVDAFARQHCSRDSTRFSRSDCQGTKTDNDER